jgi:hypothetical protein
MIYLKQEEKKIRITKFKRQRTFDTVEALHEWSKKFEPKYEVVRVGYRELVI